MVEKVEVSSCAVNNFVFFICCSFVLVYFLFCVCGSEAVNLHSPPAIVVLFSLKGSNKDCF